MTFKRRLFIVDGAEEPAMRADLRDPGTLEFYRRTTGPVRSYWLTVSEVRRYFPARRGPRDLALYDRQLLVAHDEDNQLLTFDVVGETSPEVELFDAVRELAGHEVPVLKRTWIPTRTPEGR
jgi:hypothetical protein